MLGSKSWRWTAAALALPASAGLGLALTAAPATAAPPITLGSPLTGPLEDPGECNFPLGCEATATALSEPGAITASPIAGTVVRWRAAGTTSGDGYRINVLRPNVSGRYTATAVSPVAVSAGEPTETFAADLPIAVGKYVAISLPYRAGLDLLESPGLTTEVLFEPALALDAEAMPMGSDTLRDESAFDAEVEPAPEAEPAPSPPASSATGTGPPPSSVVNAPHCQVPSLRGERLAAAKKKLVAAGCRLGKVRGRRARSARVVKQAPRAGERLAPRAEVGVVLRGRSRSTHGAR